MIVLCVKGFIGQTKDLNDFSVIRIETLSQMLGENLRNILQVEDSDPPHLIYDACTRIQSRFMTKNPLDVAGLFSEHKRAEYRKWLVDQSLEAGGEWPL